MQFVSAMGAESSVIKSLWWLEAKEKQLMYVAVDSDIQTTLHNSC